jgi:hypothetical protein
MEMEEFIHKLEAESRERSKKLEKKKEKSFAKGNVKKWEMEP